MGAYWKVSLPVNIYIKSEEDEKIFEEKFKESFEFDTEKNRYTLKKELFKREFISFYREFLRYYNKSIYGENKEQSEYVENFLIEMEKIVDNREFNREIVEKVKSISGNYYFNYETIFPAYVYEGRVFSRSCMDLITLTISESKYNEYYEFKEKAEEIIENFKREHSYELADLIFVSSW